MSREMRDVRRVLANPESLVDDADKLLIDGTTDLDGWLFCVSEFAILLVS